MCCWLDWSTTQKRAVGSEKYAIGYWLLAVGSCSCSCSCSYDPRCKSANNTDDQRVLRGSCGKRAMDGEAPELNPGWVHRRMNSCLEVRHALHKRAKPRSKAMSKLYACRTALLLFFPQRDILSRFGRSPSLATLATAPARCSWNRCVAG